MKYLDLTLPSPEANLAGDEALLDLCEEAQDGQILRVWAPEQPFVVLGYANHAADEVDLDECRACHVPVLRRCSGGGTVLQASGCLNYTLVLRIDSNPALESITGTNQFIMRAHRDMIGSLLAAKVTIEGATDLALENVKFSGNAQRRRRSALLFHGTFLWGLNIDLMARCLRFPTKEPGYRQSRSHRDFVRNLPLAPETIKESLRRTWQAEDPLEQIPWGAIERLVKERYGCDDWNRKFFRGAKK